MTPNYTWNERTGVATCTVFDPDTHVPVVGIATCAAEDEDMKSEKTGCTIAYMRASMKLLRYRRSRLKIEQHVYEDILKTYKMRPNYDKNDPYVRIVRKRCFAIMEDIKETDNIIEGIRRNLKKFIDDKDKFYQSLRKMR